MNGLRVRLVRWVGRLLNASGGALLAAGALAGWLAPRAPWALAAPPLQVLAQPLAASHLDPLSFMGADITALAVLVAVAIGFNVTILQIAGQAHSLNLVRGILASLGPFLFWWSVTTAVALAYFLLPPVYVGQLWQLYCWFGAIVLLMIAYLWDLPWRLSGDYVARWALGQLRGTAVSAWEEVEGYAVLQTALSAAGARGDLGNVRAIALRLGRFLLELRDRPAEAENTYNRARYRSLKSLLSGCAQGAASAPNAFVYHLGYVQAGVLLQAIAGGHPPDDESHHLFTGILRAVRPNPDLLNSLWTGLRHACCRPADKGTPYLVSYWQEHRGWPADDPRRVSRLATALALLHASMRDMLKNAAATDQPTPPWEMVESLYRDIAVYLGGAIAHGHQHLRIPVTALLDEVHTEIMRAWPLDVEDTQGRVYVVNAYEQYREALAKAVSRAFG
jgi:hypothetical protein